jgi:hypothetical protein
MKSTHYIYPHLNLLRSPSSLPQVAPPCTVPILQSCLSLLIFGELFIFLGTLSLGNICIWIEAEFLWTRLALASASCLVEMLTWTTLSWILWLTIQLRIFVFTDGVTWDYTLMWKLTINNQEIPHPFHLVPRWVGFIFHLRLRSSSRMHRFYI